MIRFPLVLDQLREKIHAPQEAVGRQLFENRRAQIFNAHEGQILAAVDDTNNLRYKVKLTWDDKGYRFTCSCGTFESRVCEHVWAVALTADQDGHFTGRGHAERPWKLGRGVDSSGNWTFVRQPPSAPTTAPKPEPTPRWKQTLDRLASAQSNEPPRTPWPATREIAYVVDRDETLLGQGLVVETCARDPKKDGQLSRPKPLKIARGGVADVPNADDRFILAMLAGGDRSNYGYYYGGEGAARYRLTHPLARAALPLMCRTGRCLLRTAAFGPESFTPLAFGPDERPWQLRLDVHRDTIYPDTYLVEAFLERDDIRRPLAAATLLTAGGLVFWNDRIELLDDHDAFHWITHFREHGPLRVPESQANDLAANLYASAPSAALRLPEELQLEEVRPPLALHLKIHASDPKYYYDDRLRAELTFDYAGDRIDGRSTGRALLQPDRRRVIVRDEKREADAHARLAQLGFRDGWDYRARRQLFILAPGKLAKAVAALVAEGWHVDAEGQIYHQPADFRVEVTSGIDWFELRAKVRYGKDQEVALPALLAALRKGKTMITLDDGSLGMLPEAWLKPPAPLATMGKVDGDHLRFTRPQAGLLDALLADVPEKKSDEVFEQTLHRLRTFEGIAAQEAPASFKGELRPYQKDSLAWFTFLRQFNIGGILADDMGLGKTIQVLAMLLVRKEELAPAPKARSRKRAAARNSEPGTRNASPSLIVVPRSLVFNWLEEAKRFAPSLKVLDHSHATRARATHHFADYDIVLTTYGTLRNDIAYLRDIDFDYVILDEAQAIKNAASESAKAARLLKARHRLALSGTPVQNHLGDLWSLFEFLNPGMLGASSVLSGASALSKGIDPATRDLLARALRPFILRRTKEQVAKDLPEKLEQTIFCELDAAQRKHYDELKLFYRNNLLERIKKEGLNKAKIEILEALLRLRQAACHPALIDDAHAHAASAKLDTLLPRLAEVIDEGHKALVFSQFTSLLALVRQRLDKEKVPYEYLDGQTTDRQARVHRFQSDPDCKLFLISLKAGGVGLNLTAADYVFLLDPWWNPAAEAQAIDRTHRIGQTKPIFAYRLIAKDTVEEKVLDLQHSKRALADAIINADNSVLSNLNKKDLELLLS
jgi:superfamily II DNA or RNA helicase